HLIAYLVPYTSLFRSCLGGGGHLGERPQREPARPFTDHRAGPLGGGVERQPIADVFGDTPQLFAPGHGLVTAPSQLDQGVPLPRSEEHTSELQSRENL